MTVNEKIVAPFDTVLVFSNRAQNVPRPRRATGRHMRARDCSADCLAVFFMLYLNFVTVNTSQSQLAQSREQIPSVSSYLSTTPCVSAHVGTINHIGRGIHSFHIT